ncbi:MAG: c-type cytochrome [Chloroflexi bacterium]|nr:c-type cytochrome [Chloroflexota bacterium]
MRAVTLLVGIVAIGCSQGAYPLDIFYEMHYQQSYKSHEPPRLAGVAGAVPFQAGPLDPGQAPRSTLFNTGQHLFNVNCSICHGLDAKGRGPVLERMRESYGYTPVIDPPDLTGKPAAYIETLLKARVRPFGPDSVMPPFGKLLTPAEDTAIAQYIATQLAAVPAPTPTQPEQTPPKLAREPGALVISVVGDELKFDQNRLPEVSAGSEVVLVFENISSVNQHNWVLVRDEQKDVVAGRGVVAGLQNGWLQPQDPDVIASVKLLAPGESGEVGFVAPSAGTYQFVCTFPGHNLTMFGDFVVIP